MLRLVLCCAAAVLLLGASPAQARTVSGNGLEKELKKMLRKATGVRVTKASCPDRINLEKGRRVTCRASFVSGDTTPVKVRLTDGEGHFDARTVNLLMRYIETQLEEASAEEGIDAEVVCPRARRVRRGDKFICTGTDDEGNRGIFDLTQQGDGLVEFEVRPASEPA